MSHVCNVCAGTGFRVSGLPCICGGRGTAAAETEGLRKELFDAQNEITRLQGELEKVRKEIAERKR